MFTYKIYIQVRMTSHYILKTATLYAPVDSLVKGGLVQCLFPLARSWCGTERCAADERLPP